MRRMICGRLRKRGRAEGGNTRESMWTYSIHKSMRPWQTFVSRLRFYAQPGFSSNRVEMALSQLAWEFLLLIFNI